MNRIETINLIKRFDRVCPAYVEWRQNRLAQMSHAHSTDKGDEWAEWISSMVRTLSTITEKEGNSVMSRLESGSLPIPPYGELALVVLREAKIARHPANQIYDLHPRYTCLTCRDTGLVNVWDPQFVEGYREEFAKVTRTPVDRDAVRPKQFSLDRYDPEREVVAFDYQPPDWIGKAQRWWRQTTADAGPIYFLALCNCHCRQREIYLDERVAFNRRERRLKDGRAAGMPACGQADYNPRVMPLKTPEPWDDLFNWYQGHEFNAAYEWQPQTQAPNDADAWHP